MAVTGLMSARAVFLDKDGTLVEDVPYNVNPDRIKLAAGAREGLRWLDKAGFALIVVTNQSGIARGLFSTEALAQVQLRLEELLRGIGVSLAGFYYCPHHPEGRVAEYAIDCSCRKPAPGLILRAAQELNIDLGRSWMVGDILDDVEAGQRAGCKTVLIDNGNETEWRTSPQRAPRCYARDLAHAAKMITTDEIGEASGYKSAAGFASRPE